MPTYPPIIKLPPNDSKQIGLQYGIGISQSILKQQSEGYLKQTFNYYDAVNFDKHIQDANPNAFGGYDKTSNWNGHMSSSLIGMPVMCPLKFLAGNYLDLQGQSQTIPEIIFETVLITVKQSKDIKKSKAYGRDGTVKEYIGIGDYSVEIRAIISADAPVNNQIDKRFQTGVYPRENMEEIIKLMNAPLALPIECWFLEMFNIRYLVIDDGAEVSQNEGQYTNQILILPCISDNPLIISISA